MSSASDNKPRKALGKGLSALLPSRPPNPAAPMPARSEETLSRDPSKLPLEVIHPNPDQPRTIFNPERIEELANSIRANGIIQPLVVRRKDQAFEIIAGERRWRAAKLAELREVPVVIQEVTDEKLLEISLIENIQREDLNPIETAEAFQRLSHDLGLSQEEIGRRTGKDRTTIANLMRLLKLPKEVQQLLADHRLSMGHARALLGLQTSDEQVQLANKASAQGMSVRQVEAAVQELVADREPSSGKGSGKEKAQDPNVRAASEELERALGTRVRIVEKSAQRGRIEIEYFSQEELERLYERIVGE